MGTQEGYIWKWTNYFGGWQQRWFILKDGTLTYYKDHNTTDTGCRGSYKLEACNILVHRIDPLRFDLTTSSQRIYLKTNTKPLRQKWIIQLGSTKANISEEMSDETTVTLSSYNEHKAELKTVKMLLSEQIDEIHTICNTDNLDKEKLKQCQTMINELCEEFIQTLNICTSNIIGDERECLTPLSTQISFDTSIMSLGTTPCTMSLGSTPCITENANSVGSVSDDSIEFPRLDRNNTLLRPIGTKRAQKLPSTYFSDIADRFEDLYLHADHIPTVAFLDACSALPKLLVTVGGRAIITLSIDIANNINKLKTKQKLNPRKTDTLQAMLHLEIATQTTHAKHSACQALRWLSREMNFTKELLLQIINGESNMSGRYLECYVRTLKPHHNMMSRSIYIVASKGIPYREDMLRALGHDGLHNTDAAVLQDMRSYAHAIAIVVLYIEEFYCNNKLLS